MIYPKVSIIILNWNGLKDTIECLESLKKITYPNYEVIVVDNGSPRNEGEILKEKYSDYIQVIRNQENLGFAAANNQGIQFAQKRGSQFFLILNNDVVVEKNFLEPLVENLLKDKKIGIGGAVNYDYYQPEKMLSLGRKINFWTGGSREINSPNGKKEIDSLVGCCLLIKKEVIEKIGYFYEPYFLNFEETDFCWRAKKAGFQIISEKRAKIWHKVGRSLNKTPFLTNYYYYRNKFLFIKRQAPFYIKYSFYFYYSLWLFFQFLKNLIKKKKKLAFSFLKALTDFWQKKFGKKNYDFSF
jgi:hypothetical protein